MTRFLNFLLSVLLLAAPGGALADTDVQRVPELSGYYLDGGKAEVPSGLKGPVTLLVFLREDLGTEDLQSWRDVALQFGSEIDTVFMVLMGERRGINRALVAGRLRGQVLDPEIRASMVPVFQNSRDLRARLGLGAGASALLVNKTGEILWRSSGASEQAAPADVVRSPPVAPGPAPGADHPSAEPAPTEMSGKTERPGPVTAPAPSILADKPPAPSSSLPAQMPAIEGVTLSGRTVRLPGDLSGAGTQLLLFPDIEGAGALRSALEWMEAHADGDWLVLVFNGAAPRFGRAFAAGKLRGEIETASDRGRVLPVYMDISDYEQLAGLAPCNSLGLITLDNAGAVLRVECLVR